MRVLVAEDDDGLRDVLVLGLTDAGYHVDAVERGDEAIDYLKWYEYDVAVIDWRMPGAEGIDVVSWARKNDRPTALLMLTARDTPADRIRGLDTGADDYLVKDTRGAQRDVDMSVMDRVERTRIKRANRHISLTPPCKVPYFKGISVFLL